MDAIPSAYLNLNEQGYLDWLKSQPLSNEVGVRPSSDRNPLATYLYSVLDIVPTLHTDGAESWFILGLTRDNTASLRIVLPPWTTPLVATYTMRRTFWHGPDPSPSIVRAGRALDDAGDHTLIRPTTPDTSTRRRKST